jgi:hypothetical protein
MYTPQQQRASAGAINNAVKRSILHLPTRSAPDGRGVTPTPQLAKGDDELKGQPKVRS